MMLIVGPMLAAAGCAERGERTSDEANQQQSFTTPDEAVAALVAALEKHDVAAIRGLIGPETDGLLSSGDMATDRRDREAFLARYRVRHQLVTGGPDDVMLQVGEDQWPLPVPLREATGGRASMATRQRTSCWCGGSGPTSPRDRRDAGVRGGAGGVRRRGTRRR